MKIEHIAMYVEELDSARAFFEKYFEGTSNDGYYNAKTGLRTYFISFKDGTRLELMSRPDMSIQEKSLRQNGYIHLGFSVGSKEKVDELTQRLLEDGYYVISGPRITGDGYYESCVLGPENNQVEITV